MSENEISVCRNVETPMRDGVLLAADLFIGGDPASLETDPRPVVLIRTPYNRTFVAASFDASPFLARGFLVMIQDVRGTGTSGGTLVPLMNERDDGTDTITWLTAQPWCNGQVGTTGASYMGGTQLQLVVDPVPGHEGAFIQVPAGNMFSLGMIYDGDMMTTDTAVPWVMLMAASTLQRFPPATAAAIGADLAAGDTPLPPPMGDGDVFAFLKGRSLRSLPVARHVPFWHSWLDSRENPDFFAPAEVNSKLANVSRPLLHFAGWYDLFLRNSIFAYTGITANGATSEAREGQRLIIGPWSHVDDARFRRYPGSDVHDAAVGAAWLSQCLQGVANPLFDHPVIIYVMGENRWRAEQSWPCPGAVATRFYMHGNGAANGVDGDGTLSMTAPGENELADHYSADPADPIRSLGGHGLSGGAVDQRPNASRQDILVYTSEPLAEDIEVTGEVRATIHAASSATDTDWFVKLIDVFPDGTAYNILNGGARGRYRHSRLDPVPLTPGETVAYDIDLQVTSNVFKKGHRIRIEISSSDCPNFELNPNSFVDLSTAGPDDYVIARQTVFHDAARPSWVELPIIPAQRERHWIPTPFPAGPGDRAYSKHDTAIAELALKEIEVTELPAS